MYLSVSLSVSCIVSFQLIILVFCWTTLSRMAGVANDDTDLREACGVFGCVAAGDWPTQLDVPHIICLGLVGLQHR